MAPAQGLRIADLSAILLPWLDDALLVAGDRGEMVITDAQVHIWKRDPGDPPPSNPNDHQQKWPQGFTAEALIAEMDAIGVDRTVVCPPGIMPKPVEYALEAAARHPGRLGIMEHFNPGAEEAHSRLQAIRDQKHILGIRLNLRANRQWLDDGTCDWLWPECERQGIPVTVLASAMAERLLPVAQRHPGLTITIDHMGWVPDVKGDAAFAALDGLLSLAPYTYIGVKVTSVPDSSAEPYPFRDLYGGVRRIYESFGPNRMLWGSDLSGLTCSYRDCLRHFQEGLDFLSAKDKEWILGKTAATLYNWPEA